MPKTALRKPSPEVEFPNDPMLCELHKTRLKIYSETKALNAPDLKKYFQRKSKAFRSAPSL